MKPFRLLLVAAAVGLASFVGFLAYAAQEDTARFASWTSGEAFMRTNGEPIVRAVLTPTDAAAEDNSNASGGNAVTGTLYGGERLCFRSAEAALIYFGASASQTANLSPIRVGANEPLDSACAITRPGTTKVSALCESGSCTKVVVVEKR